MSYPLILAYNGDDFARINHDGSWSVNWEKAINVRYQTPIIRSRAIIACSEIVIAAKDNFFPMPWFESDNSSDKWTHNSKTYDVMEIEPHEGEVLCKLGNRDCPVAKVNFDGTWSIKWDKVDELARESMDNWRTIALNSFCKLLMAAQYRFHTTPWRDIEKDDEAE